MKFALASLLFVAGAQTTRAAALSIVPAPVSVAVGSGTCRFVLDPRTAIRADTGLDGVARFLRGALAPATGDEFPAARRSAGDEIVLTLDPKLSSFGPEGYRLEIGSKGVAIRASRPAGAFYAVQSLLQLLPPDIFRRSASGGVVWSAPCVQIADSPRFAWRGLLLDSARHFKTKDAVLKILDLMALYKMNVLHWHLTDDEGWRLEIKRYPRLTEVGAASDYSEQKPDAATRSSNERPGGFYTQDDVREIVRYAGDRFITIVPEIELPGHSGAAIRAYPELGNRSEIAAARGQTSFLDSGETVADPDVPALSFTANGDNVFNADGATLDFFKNVLDEVSRLFPGRFVHIGGDEVWTEAWKRNPKVQARMKALGLKNGPELQNWFVEQIDAYLASKGRRLIGWDEILGGALPQEAAITSWRGVDGGVAAARAGHDVVMNPMDDTYFDHYQAKPEGLEPRAIGGYLPIEQVYRFEPVPKELTAEQAKHVLGGQMSLWGEFMPGLKQVEYMAFPRLLAFSEAVWSPSGARDWNGFQARLDEQFPKLDVLDVNYRRPRPATAPLAHWTPHDVSSWWWTVRRWDVTSRVKDAGSYRVLFDDVGDGAGVDVRWIELLENGISIQKIERSALAAGDDGRSRIFTLALRPKPGAAYVLRASLRSSSGAAASGDVYFLPSPE